MKSVFYDWAKAEYVVALYTITGGAGFIGSHLADTLLDLGHAVRILDDLSTGRVANLDRRCQFLRGDVTDLAAVREALDGADGCFHLAAIASVARASREWLAAHRVNQGGSVTVFEVARELGGLPVVYASSAAVYGDLDGSVAHEGALPTPLTAYGADKLGTELHARVAFLIHGVPTLGLRFFNVYGPRQDPSSHYSGVISIFTRRISHGLPVTIYGSGEQVRDFIHVSDVADHLATAMSHLAENPDGTVLNVCRGVGTSVLELARLICGIEGRPLKMNFGPSRAGDINHSIGDPTRAAATLGIAACTSLDEGLASLTKDLVEPSMAFPASVHANGKTALDVVRALN